MTLKKIEWDNVALCIMKIIRVILLAGLIVSCVVIIIGLLVINGQLITVMAIIPILFIVYCCNAYTNICANWAMLNDFKYNEVSLIGL